MPEQIDPAELITTAQARRILGVHAQTLYRWIRRGRLKAYRLVGRLRLRKADVLVLLKEGPARDGVGRPGANARDRLKGMGW